MSHTVILNLIVVEHVMYKKQFAVINVDSFKVGLFPGRAQSLSGVLFARQPAMM